jgi:hypothetical protein
MSNQPELSADVLSSHRPGLLSWRLGVYGGAIVGGIFWGLVALFTIGAPGDQAQHDAVDSHRVLLATAVWLVFGIVGANLVWLGRIRVVRSLGLALVVGPTGGWLIFASLALQSHIYGWG